MNLLGEEDIRYIQDHKPGWNKNSFFIPDYSERDLKSIDGRRILIEIDDFYIPPKKSDEDK